MKILYLMCKGITNHTGLENLLVVLKEGDWALVKRLMQKGQESGLGLALDKAIKELLGTIYELDHSMFSFIGEALGLKQVESPGALQFEDSESLEKFMNGEQAK